VADTYTEEELRDMKRLALRRYCKSLGGDSLEVTQMKFDEMVEFALDAQEGGGKKSSKKKSSKKSTAKKGRTSKKSTAKKSPPKTPPKGRASKSRTSKKSTTKKDEPAVEMDTSMFMEAMEELDAKLDKIAEKMDKLGVVMDSQFDEINADISELRADTYGISRRQRHLAAWMVESEVLLPDLAPEEIDLDALEEVIEEELGGDGDEGNEDGDE